MIMICIAVVNFPKQDLAGGNSFGLLSLQSLWMGMAYPENTDSCLCNHAYSEALTKDDIENLQ